MKIILSSMQTTHEPLHLRRMMFGAVKDDEKTYKFHLKHYIY
jgi:hypothetical protein